MAKNVTSKSRLCVVCKKGYTPTSNRQKYCSKDCEKVVERERSKEKHLRQYVRRGYNQKGENNNHWKGGVYANYYKRIAFEHFPKVCNRCGSVKFIVVHHIDRNRYNNDISNLEVLCRKCHCAEHDIVKNNFDPHKEVNRQRTIARNISNRGHTRCQKV